MKGIIKNIILFSIILISFTLVFSVNWIYNTYGNINLEEILFQIRVPNTDVNVDYYYSFALNALTYIIICTISVFVIISFLFSIKRKNKRKVNGKHYKENLSLIKYKKHRLDRQYLKKLAVANLILIVSVMYISIETDLKTYIYNQLSKSNFIEEEYVDAKSTNIIFPEEKRNLIYIYLESMEATFFSEENGGAYEQSIIEDLEELAKDNITFSNSEKLKGLYSLPGSGWTTGGMTAQMLGIPLKIPVEANSYGHFQTFLPGAIRNR